MVAAGVGPAAVRGGSDGRCRYSVGSRPHATARSSAWRVHPSISSQRNFTARLP
jgi:hypothetical protein